MAVTLTVAELAQAMRLGDSPEETAEATRLLSYATAAIARHLLDAYEDTDAAIVNESAIRLAAYIFDMPNAGRGLSYANAMRNSGAAAMLLPYRVHRAGSTGEAVETESPASDLGLSLLATETVTVTTTETWISTSLPKPATDVAGLSLRDPDGNDTEIFLFRIAALTDMAVAGGDASGEPNMFSMDTEADETVLFASRMLGDHILYLYQVRNA